MKKKILIVFGTRPEAIKMIPVINEIKKKTNIINLKICLTGQHTNLLHPILSFFNLKVNFDLKVMKKNQNLIDLTSVIMKKISFVLDKFKPNYVLVHGDTTTTFATSLSCFYKKINVMHVEAGLRTYNINSPFPEEFNRLITSKISIMHYAPTETNKKNLIKEGIDNNKIIVTGNTSIDAILLTKNLIKKSKFMKSQIILDLKNLLNFDFIKEKYILLTVHRRENFGNALINILKAIKEIANNNKNIHFIFPVHPNPNVKKIVYSKLPNIHNIHLIKPLEYQNFIFLLQKSLFVVSDSGGLQEEAPFLSKPVIVLRDFTERSEVINNKQALIVGSNIKKIIYYCEKLIKDKKYFLKMAKTNFIYGNGNASKIIVKNLTKLIKENEK